MKKIKTILSVSAMAAILFIASCKKEIAGPAGAQGSAGPALSGTLSGFISLYDQYGTRILTPSSLDSVKVSIDNTTRMCLTDTFGKYNFASLSTGNYNITISDTLYGSNKIQDLQFVGGGNVDRDVKISQIPTFTMSNCTAVDTVQNAINYVKVRGNIVADPRARTVVFFASAYATVSSAPTNYILTYSRVIAGSATTFSLLIPATDFYDAGMPSTSTVYCAAYSAATNYASSSVYEDFNSGRFFYTAIGATPITFNVMVP